MCTPTADHTNGDKALKKKGEYVQERSPTLFPGDEEEKLDRVADGTDRDMTKKKKKKKKEPVQELHYRHLPEDEDEKLDRVANGTDRDMTKKKEPEDEEEKLDSAANGTDTSDVMIVFKNGDTSRSLGSEPHLEELGELGENWRHFWSARVHTSDFSTTGGGDFSLDSGDTFFHSPDYMTVASDSDNKTSEVEAGDEEGWYQVHERLLKEVEAGDEEGCYQVHERLLKKDHVDVSDVSKNEYGVTPASTDSLDVFVHRQEHVITDGDGETGDVEVVVGHDVVEAGDEEGCYQVHEPLLKKDHVDVSDVSKNEYGVTPASTDSLDVFVHRQEHVIMEGDGETGDVEVVVGHDVVEAGDVDPAGDNDDGEAGGDHAVESHDGGEASADNAAAEGDDKEEDDDDGDEDKEDEDEDKEVEDEDKEVGDEDKEDEDKEDEDKEDEDKDDENKDDENTDDEDDEDNEDDEDDEDDEDNEDEDGNGGGDDEGDDYGDEDGDGAEPSVDLGDGANPILVGKLSPSNYEDIVFDICPPF